MKTKTFRGPIQIKEDGEPGEFRAVFSTLNVVDNDEDVTLSGAFQDGQKVRIAYWGHRWQDLPVGRGIIGQDDKKAWVDGRFFLDTEAGMQTYLTVKNLGELQEWSYGYDVDESRHGQFEGQDVRFLERLTVYEISPVMLGAGIDTRTETIKGEDIGRFEAATDEGKEDGEGRAGVGTGEPSGVPPSDVLLQIEIMKLQTEV